MTFLSEVGRLCRLPPKMKLFLAAISIIAAIHYGHGITLNKDTSACDVSKAFEGAMGMTRTMTCDTMLTTGADGIKEFNPKVSKAGLCFQSV